jgi:hypothetical protein
MNDDGTDVEEIMHIISEKARKKKEIEMNLHGIFDILNQVLFGYIDYAIVAKKIMDKRRYA